MAKGAPKKKASSTGRNGDRPNGKAWKKPKKAPTPPTPERAAKDVLVRLRREVRKEENITRRALEKQAAEELELMRQAEEEAAKRHDPIGVVTRIKKKRKQSVAA